MDTYQNINECMILYYGFFLFYTQTLQGLSEFNEFDKFVISNNCVPDISVAMTPIKWKITNADVMLM